MLTVVHFNKMMTPKNDWSLTISYGKMVIQHHNVKLTTFYVALKAATRSQSSQPQSKVNYTVYIPWEHWSLSL